MVEQEIDLLIGVEDEPERYPDLSGRQSPSAAAAHSPEVYVVPDGMVDIALRELDARLVIDDSEPSAYRSAA
jgi:hypothetical protein